jgi:hypothetical protein
MKGAIQMSIFRRVCCTVTLTALLACIAAPLFASDWSRAYVLTPVEHKRLRARGLKDKEIYAIANLTAYSGRHVDDITDMAIRGDLLPMTVRNRGIDPAILTQMRPEWGTPAWEEAVKRGDFLWVAPR